MDKPLAGKIETLTGLGLSPADIAIVIEVPEAELKATYAHELASGRIKANAKVAESLFRQATSDGRQSVAAAIFWLKARACWKDTTVHQHGPMLSEEAKQIVFNTIYENRGLL